MVTATTEPAAPSIAVTGEEGRFALEGVLDVHTIAEARRSLHKPREVDLAKLSGLDTPRALFLCVMIAIVIAYQGVVQLRPYGGEDFTINLVAVSVLREMGVLITAIMVAGRSGSAFTAEIGVMKAREEIDALEVMGLDPMQVLVVPRLIGLVITLPLLTFFSDVMGLAGGSAISQALPHVSPAPS